MEIAKLSMTPEQSRHYNKYYTSTNLNVLANNTNKLNTYPGKYDNYETEKLCTLSDEEQKNISIYFNHIYDN